MSYNNTAWSRYTLRRTVDAIDRAIKLRKRHPVYVFYMRIPNGASNSRLKLYHVESDFAYDMMLTNGNELLGQYDLNTDKATIMRDVARRLRLTSILKDKTM